MTKSNIKCKISSGMKVCKVASADGITLTMTAPMGFDPIPITIFTSPYCSWCNTVEKTVKKTTHKIKDMVKINVVNIDSPAYKSNLDENVKQLPVVKIGREKYIRGNIDEDQLLINIFNNAKNRSHGK